MGDSMVISVVVNAGPLRYSEYALDAARYAADNPADYAAYGSSDRACYMIALRGPFLGTSNNALSMCRHGYRKKDKCQ
jgi:hypothetical protein